MKFSEIVEQVLDVLRRQGRVSYRLLKREFELNDDDIEDLKAELIDARRIAADEDGKVLVWVGSTPQAEPEKQGNQATEQKLALFFDPRPQTLDARHSDAERRQLTVMFCDLVGSTALSTQLDPEELREVVRAYQQTCAEAVQRYDGHIAQYLGDGVLVYFGYPVAHEDDAARAVRAGLEIIAALGEQGSGNGERERRHALPVRVGVHTGPVVIGEIGGGGRHEHLALGETPNLAARVQALADPNAIVISAVTRHLVMGLFECQDLGPQELKGFSSLVSVYRVVRESAAQNRFEAEVHKGLTPLVGRDLEVGLLRERWERVKAGAGQVVLLNGEPGIGKSRLVQVLKEQIVQEGATRLELRCSSYRQHSAYHPILDHLQRILGFTAQDSSQTKLDKLTGMLARYRFPQLDTLPLLAAFLSLPHPEKAPPLSMSPQKQKEKTQAAIVAWLVEEAERAPVYCVWEDVHWADPSTLEVLTLLLAQVPATRLLVLVTFRPEFTSSWRARSYFSQVTLNRLDRAAVETMVAQMNAGKSLPLEVMQQIVTKTDGVPLFVEELTKMVLESGLAAEAQHAPAAQVLGIPATLQDALMARLDRLAPVREIAQMGAVLGREFSYEILQAISRLDEDSLQQGLRQLVETELVYQRGIPPHATYTFKHALIQDTAYQSLLKSRRQQLHQQVAQILAERFPTTQETQPELLAHHYTEAGLVAQAIPHWQKAGQRAAQRSANAEAVAHLTKGIELLKTLPESLEHVEQELMLQLTLGPVYMVTKSIGSVEVENIYTRARELCQQIGETPQLFPALWGLRRFYALRVNLKAGQELEEQLVRLAQSVQDPALLLEAYFARGTTSFWLGQMAFAREYLEQSLALYDPQQHHSHAFLYGSDPGVSAYSYNALALWHLGYPDKALEEIRKSLALAQKLAHPFSQAYALNVSAWLYWLRRENQTAQSQAETAIRLSTKHDLPHWVSFGKVQRGGALAEQGSGEEGIIQISQGLADHRALGAEAGLTMFLAVLSEAYWIRGQNEDGLKVVIEALDIVDKKGERAYEAELYRLKGELLLAQEGHRLQAVGYREKTEEEGLRLQAIGLREKTEEAEGCFLRAIEITQQQQAKSLELRATMSLARLWQSQGKTAEARQMLAEIYGWFTEGFATKDLQEAKALLDELA